MEEMDAALCARKQAFFREPACPNSSHNTVKHWGEVPSLQLLTSANSGDLKIEFLRIFIGAIMLVSSNHKTQIYNVFDCVRAANLILMICEDDPSANFRHFG